MLARQLACLLAAASAIPVASAAVAQTAAAPAGAAVDTGSPEVSGDAQTANDIVVTGTSTRQRKFDAPYSVSTIDRQRIDETAPHSVADLLQATPGITVEASGVEGGGENVVIRGLLWSGWRLIDLNQDGMPLFESNTERCGWGGAVPLGYELHERKLVVHDGEAELVRHIFQRYLELSSVVALADELNAAGHRTKLQSRSSGPHRGGCPFRRGTLYHLLSNRIYRGAIVHKGEAHPGEPDAVVGEPLWDAVQAKVERGRSKPASRSPTALRLPASSAMALGRQMTPTHARKGNRRYRYYVIRPEACSGPDGAAPARRTGAYDLERIVTSRITAFLADDIAIGRIAAAIEPTKMKAAITKAAACAADGAGILNLAGHVRLEDAVVSITIAQQPLLAALGLQSAAEHDPIILTAPIERIRKGHQLRLVVPGDAPPLERDTALIKLLADAFDARELVAAHPDQPIHRIAASHGRCRKRLGNFHRVSYLAPDIITAILDGVQPATLTPAALLAADLPLSWADQKAALGFA